MHKGLEHANAIENIWYECAFLEPLVNRYKVLYD